MELSIKILSLVILLYYYYMLTYYIFRHGHTLTYPRVISGGHGTIGYQLPFGLRILCDDPIIDIFRP